MSQESCKCHCCVNGRDAYNGLHIRFMDISKQLSEAQKELEASRLECEALKQSNKKVIMDAEIYIHSRISMRNIQCNERDLGKREVLELLHQYANTQET